jgi:ligand-binding SRPBCC domain-containing protein
MTIRVSSTLPVPAEVAGDLMRKPALLQHVTWPILSIRGLPETVVPGQRMEVRLALLGIVPLWRHTITVVTGDTLDARTEEHGGPLRAWRHHLRVEPLSPTSCRYTDEVDIDAGRLTPVARAMAALFYRYRHRRWRALTRVLA